MIIVKVNESKQHAYLNSFPTRIKPELIGDFKNSYGAMRKSIITEYRCTIGNHDMY